MFGLKTVQVLHWHLFRGITNYLASSRGLATAEVGEMKRRKKNTSFPFGISWWLLQLYAFRQDFFFSSPGHLTNGGSSGSLKHQRNFVPFCFFVDVFWHKPKTRVNSYVCSTSAIGWGPARCLLLQNFIPSSSSCVRGSASLMHARARGVRSPCNTPVAVIPVWRVPWLATLVGGGMCVRGGIERSGPASQLGSPSDRRGAGGSMLAFIATAVCVKF